MAETKDFKKKEGGRPRYENRSGGNSGGYSKRRVYLRRKVCRFCVDKSLKINYKEFEILRRFTTDGGKIIPKRISGNCSKHQRMLSKAIKVARAIALLPYTKN